MRRGVSSTRIASRLSARARSSDRATASSRSKRARKRSSSRGRGLPAMVRRPSTISTCVPDSIWESGMAPPISATIRCASPAPTPERRSMRSKLSPAARVATSSRRGRSGAAAKGRTSAVAPMRWPVSAPRASGAIVWLRNSSRSASFNRAGGAASNGAKSGQKAIAALDRPMNVPTPRSQRRLPIPRPRSGARSSAESRAERRSRQPGAVRSGGFVGEGAI